MWDVNVVCGETTGVPYHNGVRVHPTRRCSMELKFSNMTIVHYQPRAPLESPSRDCADRNKQYLFPNVSKDCEVNRTESDR
jgi:hypothetical protein